MASKKHSNSPATSVKRNMFFVLGMHRSGTSALSGLLAGVGADAPKTLMQATEHNPKGYFESQPIFRLNDRMLKTFGSSWRDWRDMPSDWIETEERQAFLTEATEILKAEFPNGSMAVFKDPRVCRMMPFWTQAAEAAEFSVLPMLIHRNPLEVARSLEERDGIPTVEGLMIWLQHVLAAEYATRKTKRFITSYTQILTDWSAQIAGIQETFDITFQKLNANDRSKIDSFITPKLRHFSKLPESVSKSADVSNWVRTTYEILEDWANKGEDKSSYKTLNQIRLELERTTPTLSQLLNAKEQKFTHALQERTKQVKRAQAKSHETIIELQAEQAKTKGLNEKVRTLNQSLTQITAKLIERDKDFLSLRDQQYVVMSELLVRTNETSHTNDRLAAEIKGIEVALTAKAKEAANLRTKLAAMNNSTFWRMTKPLRKIVSVMRGKS